MDLTAEHRAYLKNKHKGGLNNQKGNTYEVIYATKEIIRLFAEEEDWDNTLLASQVENVFVDDFQIIYPSKLIIYHQCKDSQYLDWNIDEKGKPLYDFKWQKHYSGLNGESFNLKIVYSKDNCDVHSSPIPSTIVDVTQKEFFPSYPTLTDAILEYPEFSEYIKEVSGMENGCYSLDRLSCFAEVIRSQWLELGVPNKPVSLSEIKSASVSKYGSLINFKDTQNVELSDKIKEIIGRFPEVNYHVNGSTVQWIYGKLSGYFIVTDELCNKLVQNNPSDVYHLISLLN